MFKIFYISFRLKISYRVNTILYSLKQLPFIKKLLPASLYASKTLKRFALLLAILMEIISIPLFKGLYLFVMILLPILLTNTSANLIPQAFLHILLFLTIAGSLSNNTIFSPSKDKYYAIIQMRMNARNFTLVNYVYEMAKIFAGMALCLIPLCIIFHLPYIFIIWIPVMIIAWKTVFGAWSLRQYETKHILRNESNPVKYVWFTIAATYLLAYAGIFIKQYLPLFLSYLLGTFMMILGIFAYAYMRKFPLYRAMYQQLLSQSTSAINVSMQNITNDTYRKNISNDTGISSDKKGYAYFHDLFIKRHQKLLWYSAKKTAVITFVIFVIACAALITIPQAKEPINHLLLVFLPYFVFIIYSCHSGKSVVQAMFRNCDHSMLTYSFYRRPDVILSLFRLRLFDVIRINLLPASIIAIGLPILLYISGGTSNPLTYLIIFICIIATSTFFSIHFLTCYYLLQPYNEATETKSSLYSIVMSLTYLICFGFIYLKMDTFIFGTIMIIFCIVYTIISMTLVYRMAYKTFKLRR